MDLRQIIITPPIKKAILEINPEMDLSTFELNKSLAKFPLSRMSLMMSANFEQLLKLNPIEIKPKIIHGQKMCCLIEGQIKPLYEIINGRHRVARAIIDGHKKINVKIL